MSCLQNELLRGLRKRKVVVSFGVTMIILFFLIFIVNTSSSREIPRSDYLEGARNNEKLDLKLVHVVSKVVEII